MIPNTFSSKISIKKRPLLVQWTKSDLCNNFQYYKSFKLRADDQESVSTVHRHRSKIVLCNSSMFLFSNFLISCCLLDGEHILLTNLKHFIAFCIHSISPSDKVVTQLTPLYYFFFFVIFTLIL